jgi:hypothetical protein
MVNKQHLLVKRSVDDRACCSAQAASTNGADCMAHAHTNGADCMAHAHTRERYHDGYLLRMRREVQVGVFALLQHAM